MPNRPQGLKAQLLRDYYRAAALLRELPPSHGVWMAGYTEGLHQALYLISKLFPEPMPCPVCGTTAKFIRDRGFKDGSGLVYTCLNTHCDNHHLYFYAPTVKDLQPAPRDKRRRPRTRRSGK